MKAVSYIGGIPKQIPINHCGAVLEVQLQDGRTVQLSVGDDGLVNLRAWGNVPAKVVNGDQAGASFKLAFEPQTSCPTCYDRLNKCLCGGNQ